MRAKYGGEVTVYFDDGEQEKLPLMNDLHEHVVRDHAVEIVDDIKTNGVMVLRDGCEHTAAVPGHYRHYMPRRVLHMDVDIWECLCAGP